MSGFELINNLTITILEKCIAYGTIYEKGLWFQHLRAKSLYPIQ